MADIKSFYPLCRMLPRRAVLRFGNIPLPARPLTLAQVMQLWDAFRGILPKWVAFLGAQGTDEVPDTSWIREMYVAGAHVVWPDETQIDEILERATEQQLVAAYRWFVDNHDWTRILAEVFDVRFEPESERITDIGTRRLTAIDCLYEIEVETGRKIEEQLSMPPEAFLDLLATIAKRTKDQNEARRRAQAEANGGTVVDSRIPGLGLMGVPGMYDRQVPQPPPEIVEEPESEPS